MLLGVGGKKRSGKDTVCNILVKRFGFRTMAFADNLREMSSLAFDVPERHFTADHLKEQEYIEQPEITQAVLNILHSWIKTKHAHLVSAEALMDAYKTGWKKFIGMKLETPRHILQIVGTEMIRDIISPTYHADVVLDKITPSEQFWCISDARFPNERELIKKQEGQLLMVDDPNETATQAHASETQLGSPKDYDFYILNDKTKGMEVLELAVEQVAKQIFNIPV